MMPEYTNKCADTPDFFKNFELEAQKPLPEQSPKTDILEPRASKSTKSKTSPGTVEEKPKQTARKAHRLPPLEERYLRDREVGERFSICRQQVWKKAKAGSLPSPVKLSANTTRWRLSDLLEREAELQSQFKGSENRLPRSKKLKNEGQA